MRKKFIILAFALVFLFPSFCFAEGNYNTIGLYNTFLGDSEKNVLGNPKYKGAGTVNKKDIDMSFYIAKQLPGLNFSREDVDNLFEIGSRFKLGDKLDKYLIPYNGNGVTLRFAHDNITDEGKLVSITFYIRDKLATAVEVLTERYGKPKSFGLSKKLNSIIWEKNNTYAFVLPDIVADPQGNIKHIDKDNGKIICYDADGLNEFFKDTVTAVNKLAKNAADKEKNEM